MPNGRSWPACVAPRVAWQVRASRSGTIGTVDAAPETGHRLGQPRSERDAAFLKRFDARMQLPIVVSAIVPLVVVPESTGWVGAVVGVVTWLVFLADYVVHARHLEHYGRTAFGRFDLFVVIAAAPWFLLPGAQAGGFVVLLRLARLARLVMATRGARRLFERLGRVAAAAAGIVLIGSLAPTTPSTPPTPPPAGGGADRAADRNTPRPTSAGAPSRWGRTRLTGIAARTWQPGVRPRTVRA
jgi:hypothetical protein